MNVQTDCRESGFLVCEEENTMDRRDFLCRLSGKDRVVRPPGAASEDSFSKNCNRCGDCADACPQSIISSSANGLPMLSFSQRGCTFCGRCAEVCQTGALVARTSWALRARVSPDCLDRNGIVCRACESTCEADAIRFRPALAGRTDVSIALEDCTGCGACIGICPAGAISLFRPKATNIPHKEKAA